MTSTLPHRRGRGRQQVFLISVLVAALLLAIAGVTTVTSTMTDTVGGTGAEVLPPTTAGVTATTPTVPDTARGPQADIVPPAGDLPPIPAAAYLVLDGDTGEPLAALNADQPRPVASLAKLMTARLVLDAGQLDRTVTVPPLQMADDESRAGLEPGDQAPRHGLLQAMLVASAGDAARTLAVDVAGTEQGFVGMMNAEAEAAGLDATHYANPVGLDDPAQHSSAADVAHLARELMHDPVFRQIVAAGSTTIDGSTLPATNDLLGTYPGADGVKTGYTDEAGWCIAASATRDGHTIIVVVLGAPTEHARNDAAAALLDYAFTQQTGTTGTTGTTEAPPTGGQDDEQPTRPDRAPARPGVRS